MRLGKGVEPWGCSNSGSWSPSPHGTVGENELQELGGCDDNPHPSSRGARTLPVTPGGGLGERGGE